MSQQRPNAVSSMAENSNSDSDLNDSGPASTAQTQPIYYWLVVGLHLLIVLANLAPSFFYFQRSWELEHYQFFPIALLVFGFIVFIRLDRGVLRENRWVPVVCTGFLLISIFSFLVSIFQYNHYLPVVGAIFATGSLLFCLEDKETRGSLLPTWLLLLPLIRIPLNFDITLISELQFFSAAFASNVLDFLGIANFTPGTVIQVAEQGTESGVKKFDVERACSGVQSLYTLIFCTLTVAVWARRSFVAGLILVASGVFWSITMNGMRIVICVSFYHWFDFDVYSGLRHDILGYIILFSAIGLIASTDAFLGFLISPIDVAAESRNILARIWNRLIVGVRLFSHRSDEVPLSPFASKLIKGTLVSVVSLTSLCALILAVTSLSSSNFAGTRKIGELNLEESQLPQKISGMEFAKNEEGIPLFRSWTLVESSMSHTTRNANSTYGPYSTEWLVQEQTTMDMIQVSLDYTFLGWHELKVCYKARGWKVDRAVIPDENWKPVELYLSKPNGEEAYCVFSIFDYEGNPVEPLSDNLGFFLLRLKNRINRELSTIPTFQIQCFIQSFGDLPKERIEATRELHLKLREEMKKTVVTRVEEMD